LAAGVQPGTFVWHIDGTTEEFPHKATLLTCWEASNDGSGDTEVGRNLYPRAPDMRAAATQQLSDGELFFIIQNGIRLTGMPAWGSGAAHDAQDSWKLVRFIRHLPEVSPAEAQEMSKMNPKTPAELEEERAEEEFLNGAHRPESVVRQENGGNPHAPEHHHH